MLLSEAIKEFLIRLKLKGKSEATRKNTGFHLEKFRVWLLDQYNIEDSRFIRKSQLTAYQKFLGLDNGFSPSYINQKVIAVNSLMRFLRKEGQVVQDVEEVLECMKEPKRLPQVISMEEYDQIRKAEPLKDKITMRNYTIMTLLMSTGIRVGALSRIKVNDINMDEMTIKVIGKGNKERLVIFGEQCKEVLRVYLQSIRPTFRGAKSCEALFISRNRKPMSIRTFQDLIRQTAQKAGIEQRVTPHTFRRTFCTELIKADGNLYHVAQMMGHESLEHLKCYARLNVKPLKDTHKRCHPRG